MIGLHRSAFFGGEVPAADRGYRTIETPWGLGRQFFTDFYATSLKRRSAWPETQIVMDLYWQVHPDRHFVVMKSLWPPDRWHEEEPPYNDMYGVNLVESIHKHGPRWLAMQPTPVVYFIWQTPVDLGNPPAPGDPPLELMRARAEVEQIKNQWVAGC